MLQLQLGRKTYTGNQSNAPAQQDLDSKAGQAKILAEIRLLDRQVHDLEFVVRQLTQSTQQLSVSSKALKLNPEPEKLEFVPQANWFPRTLSFTGCRFAILIV